MDTLLEQLARATAPRRSGAWVLGAGGLVAAAIVLTRGEPTEAIDPCASAGAEANELASGRAERLVHFASAWTIARKEGCIAHRDGSISADLYDRRQACLDGELAAVRTRVELEGEVDAAIAIDPTAPSRCTDAVRLTAGPIPGSEGRAAWIDLREQLARAEASLARGDLATVDAIVATLTVPTVDDGRLADDIVANAAWLSARSLRAKGELDAALAATTDAAARADAIPDDELRARALVEAVRLAGVDLYRADEAHRLAALAHGALARAGVETMLAPGLHEALGLTAMYEGRLDVAATELQAALDGTHAPKTRATMLANLASVRLRSGDATRAVADLEQAALQLEAHAPDDEVALSGVLNNLGFALLAAGQPARALSVHERSLVLRERLFGIVSLEVANAAGGIGLALLELGRAGDARGAFERALAIRTATEGRPEDLAEVQFGLARALGSADPRALELANAALDAYRSPPLLDAFAREAATVAAWLAPTHMLDREVPP
jgi:tetratricopeptide (TPR) repeat protein